MNVSKSRSLVKSIVWRMVAICTTFFSIYIITKEVKIATAGALLTNIINFILYYLHERFWDKVQWGRS
jgi:uncharacterized membrane protein